jgi:branched-chain amino acid aminotransferase
VSQTVFYNGSVIAAENVPVGIGSRSFRYGDSLFESIRVINTRPMFLQQHLNRLKLSMASLKMEPILPLSTETIEKAISQVINSNKLFKGCRIRLTVFRDGSGFYTPDTNRSNVLIEAFGLDQETWQLNSKGLTIDIFPDFQKSLNPLFANKSGNSLLYVMAGIWAKEKKVDDCLILNENNYICEAINSNVFIFKDNSLITPAISEGCIPGIMREVVIKLALQMGITVFDDNYVTKHELSGADEIFLTNAIRGVQYVVAYKNKRYYNKLAKKLTTELNKL